jgi:hypothetical protein
MTNHELRRLINISRKLMKSLAIDDTRRLSMSLYTKDLRIALRRRKAADRITGVAK